MDVVSEEQSAKWPVFGTKVPKSEIVFFCQIIILYTVIIVSIYNLTREKETNLWISLLSSCLGYILPAPKLK